MSDDCSWDDFSWGLGDQAKHEQVSEQAQWRSWEIDARRAPAKRRYRRERRHTNDWMAMVEDDE